MKDDAWQNDDWSEEAQEIFWKRARRSRHRIIDVILEKAEFLHFSVDPEKMKVAQMLLDDVVSAYVENRESIREKQKYPRSYKMDVIKASHILANFQTEVGLMQDAIIERKRLWSIYFDDFEVPNSHEEWLLELPRLLIVFGQKDEAAEFLHHIENHFKNSTSSQYLFPELAIIWRLHGDEEKERGVFTDYLRWRSGGHWLDYDQLARMSILGPDEMPYTYPNYAAEAIVVYFFTEIKGLSVANRKALESLDILLKPKLGMPPIEWEWDFLQRSLVPELGAFIGRVLVEEHHGEWEIAYPLMQSRVVISPNKQVDPFYAAFEAVFFYYSLVDKYDDLLRN